MFTFCILLVWPFQQGLRFLINLVPFFIFFSLKGFLKFTSSINLIFLYKFVVIVVILFSLNTLITLSLNANYKDSSQNTPYETAAKEMFSFIKIHTKKTDLISFVKPRAMLLFTGRDTKLPSYNILSDREIAYFVFYNNDDLIEKNNLKKLYNLVFENKKFRIYKSL
jgi:hypothetical protein